MEEGLSQENCLRLALQLNYFDLLFFIFTCNPLVIDFVSGLNYELRTSLILKRFVLERVE